MSHCHGSGHNHHLITPMLDIMGLEGSGLVIAAFITGLAISLTHCIGMCGPFALMQLNLRLMSIPADKISQKTKMKFAIFMPYYFGKTLTYCFIASVLYFFPFGVVKGGYYNIITIILLGSAALFFLIEGVSQFVNFNLYGNLGNKLAFSLSSFLKAINLKSRNLSGFVSGIILGFIPCGALYAALTSIAGLSSSLSIVIASSIGFGIATIPGLFLVAYLGDYFTSKLRKKLKWIYGLIMLINGFLIIKYLLKICT